MRLHVGLQVRLGTLLHLIGFIIIVFLQQVKDVQPDMAPMFPTWFLMDRGEHLNSILRRTIGKKARKFM